MKIKGVESNRFLGSKGNMSLKAPLKNHKVY